MTKGNTKHTFRFLHFNRSENLIYIALWVLLFSAPVMSLYIRMLNDDNVYYNWDEIFDAWKFISLFLIIFICHNTLLAPLLIRRRKTIAYLAGTAVILAIFTLAQCMGRPEYPREGSHYMPPPEFVPPPTPSQRGADFLKTETAPPPRGRFIPPFFAHQMDFVSVLTALLMIGMNLGVKFYFKSEEDNRNLQMLENKSLEQQLEYLKYQINPHFFMNTLNNIHALVDIDPEKAKATIVELSKMMRYVLYEGSKKSIPLQRETQFLSNYITLMRMRYTDHVRIEIEPLTSIPDKSLPPLLLIIFVENAFKHGISYTANSYISISLKTNGDRLIFACDNSNHAKQGNTHGGVGLANVQKRLGLIYGEDYQLNINGSQEAYHVDLQIPLFDKPLQS